MESSLGPAKKLAGVECRMHDLRHSFVSKLAETQTPDATIQALSGHLSREMLEHYSHVRAEAKRLAVDPAGRTDRGGRAVTRGCGRRMRKIAWASPQKSPQ